MDTWITHLYQFAEVYTVLLVWIAVPLGFAACFIFLRNHFHMFVPTKPQETVHHGSD